MKPEDISYANMNRKLGEAVPELREAYDRQVARGYDGDGPHVLYEEFFAEVLPDLFGSESKHEALLRRLFSFLETLANHPEVEIQNVVYVSVCEDLCCDEVALQRAQKYMGKTTKKFCDELLAPFRKVPVFVRLLGAGAEASRPTEAEVLPKGLYRVLATPSYRPEVERWEFPPGAVVRCAIRTDETGKAYLLAVKP